MSREHIAGAALAASRRVTGISQHDMGKRIGTSQVRVSQLERDPSSMRLSMLYDWRDSVNEDGKQLVDNALQSFLCSG